MFRILTVFFAATFPVVAMAGPLHDAARQGDVGTIHEIVAQGADPNEKAQNGETPLTLAVLGGHEEVARALIESGADVHARNAGGFTPLHAAAYAGDVAIADLLIDHGADVDDARNKAGVTPLLAASEEDHAAVAELLIAAGADLGPTERHGYTALTRAMFRGHDDIVILLKAHGAQCQSPQVLGDSLHRACIEAGD
jgi:uncharacterized protein